MRVGRPRAEGSGHTIAISMGEFNIKQNELWGGRSLTIVQSVHASRKRLDENASLTQVESDNGTNCC